MNESFSSFERRSNPELDGHQVVKTFLAEASDEAASIWSNEISNPLTSFEDFHAAIEKFNRMGEAQLAAPVSVEAVSGLQPIVVPPGRRVLVERRSDGTLHVQGEGMVALDATVAPEPYEEEEDDSLEQAA